MEPGKDIFSSIESLAKFAAQSDPTFLYKLLDYLRRAGIETPETLHTPYLNTIPASAEPVYPGNRELERKIKSVIRWNAMAMVVQANRIHPGLGGHISTYASAATLYEVAFNHFFRGAEDGSLSDMVYFQGHASPGIYARAFLEGRLSARQMHGFRQELESDHGLPSYPHPYLMPDFWQFPTVSMGLGPILSIYQARFNRYLSNRGLLKGREPKVWTFVGDGETDEPECLGSLALAGREKLDNLIWVVNCNLQRLDGPVRGNGKIIQELEAVFRGSGWNVIKVIWGSDWDRLLAKDRSGLLAKRMEEALDGDYQKYSVEPGSYTRRHFFGKYPELLELVSDLSDDQIHRLTRGGHDPQKVYAAYKAAMDTQGRPTVILAKTVKGYGLGEAGEGRNITHQQKKLNEKELREFRDRFDIPVSDEEIAEAPFYRPPQDSPQILYLYERRSRLGGFVPCRSCLEPEKLDPPADDVYKEFIQTVPESEMSTTMAFVRILSKLLKDPAAGGRIVPIVPDEARTFGLDALFRQFGIYSSIGQLYEPVDKESLLYYQESKTGQILEEGLTEAGGMSSFVAAGASYTNLKVPMIPFYIFYSMFGFQRIGDLIWLAGDIRARGFMLGATAGRTTLAGEGLQHQDGHSLLMAAAHPTLLAYDPAFLFEIAVIIRDGIRRMVAQNEDVLYYLTLHNENYPMSGMPEGSEQGILEGLYKFRAGICQAPKARAQIFGSGAILREALRAQEILAEQFGVNADVWSATSYKRLRSGAVAADRWNRLHPGEPAQKSYLERVLADQEGPFVAVSDHVRLVADQIAPWVPGGMTTLGTDGYGCSDIRKRLRRYFEVDAEMIAIAVLQSLSQKGKIETDVVTEAIRRLGVDPEKAFPVFI